MFCLPPSAYDAHSKFHILSSFFSYVMLFCYTASILHFHFEPYILLRKSHEEAVTHKSTSSRRRCIHSRKVGSHSSNEILIGSRSCILLDIPIKSINHIRPWCSFYTLLERLFNNDPPYTPPVSIGNSLALSN